MAIASRSMTDEDGEGGASDWLGVGAQFGRGGSTKGGAAKVKPRQPKRKKDDQEDDEDEDEENDWDEASNNLSLGAE